MRILFASLLVAFALLGCPGTVLFPTCEEPGSNCPPVTPDYPEDAATDAPATPAGRACRALRLSGCPEGYKDGRTRKTCYQRLTSEAQLALIPIECVAATRTADAVRACGTKDTLRFRCRTASVTP